MERLIQKNPKELAKYADENVYYALEYEDALALINELLRDDSYVLTEAEFCSPDWDGYDHLYYVCIARGLILEDTSKLEVFIEKGWRDEYVDSAGKRHSAGYLGFEAPTLITYYDADTDVIEANQLDSFDILYIKDPNEKVDYAGGSNKFEELSFVSDLHRLVDQYSECLSVDTMTSLVEQFLID